jgi:CRISPR-associated exonuclease Cas4
MEEGKTAQEMIEQLEMRRTLREYGLEGAVRRFGVWLNNEDLGLTGKLDLLLDTPADAAIVEFKLTSGEIGRNHRLQLAGYALLVEAEMAKSVRCGFVYRIPDGRLFPVSIDEALRVEVRQALAGIRAAITAGWLPEATDVRKRCEECEYANFCGDVW